MNISHEMCSKIHFSITILLKYMDFLQSVSSKNVVRSFKKKKHIIYSSFCLCYNSNHITEINVEL